MKVLNQMIHEEILLKVSVIKFIAELIIMEQKFP